MWILHYMTLTYAHTLRTVHIYIHECFIFYIIISCLVWSVFPCFQRHHLNILLQGFSDRNEFVGLIYDGKDHESSLNPYTVKLYNLCQKMISYLHFSMVRMLHAVCSQTAEQLLCTCIYLQLCVRIKTSIDV